MTRIVVGLSDDWYTSGGRSWAWLKYLRDGCADGGGRWAGDGGDIGDESCMMTAALPQLQGGTGLDRCLFDRDVIVFSTFH
jgi:hypothetical protein